MQRCKWTLFQEVFNKRSRNCNKRQRKKKREKLKKRKKKKLRLWKRKWRLMSLKFKPTLKLLSNKTSKVAIIIENLIIKKPTTSRKNLLSTSNNKLETNFRGTTNSKEAINLVKTIKNLLFPQKQTTSKVLRQRKAVLCLPLLNAILEIRISVEMLKKTKSQSKNNPLKSMVEITITSMFWTMRALKKQQWVQENSLKRKKKFKPLSLQKSLMPF